jgi:addiction module HigA family antidote
MSLIRGSIKLSIKKGGGGTPRTALRLAKFFGMTEDFWMNLQIRWDLYKAKNSEAKALKTIKQYRFKPQAVHS